MLPCSCAGGIERMTLTGCLCSDPPGASFEGGNDLGSGQGLFRIRIEFQISSRKSSPELGSDYGTKPSRSFHEETVHPHCPGNRAHPERIPQRVCQRVHQHASPRLVRNTDRKPGLLWRRSGRGSRSGLRTVDCSADQAVILLRRRSGRGLRPGVRTASSLPRDCQALILVGRLSARRDGQ